MKFDPKSWFEVKPNEPIQVEKGELRLRASAIVPLYAETQGFEALVGVQSAFEVEFSEAVTVRFEASKGVRAFVYRPLQTSLEPVGEVFTNIDRMPDESGALAEVTRARRMFEFERRSMLREIRQERDAALRLMQGERSSPAPSAAASDAADTLVDDMGAAE